MNPYMCPNCNGQGPFLELVVVQAIGKDGQPQRTEQMGDKFYMCISERVDGVGSTGCNLVSTLKELAR